MITKRSQKTELEDGLEEEEQGLLGPSVSRLNLNDEKSGGDDEKKGFFKRKVVRITLGVLAFVIIAVFVRTHGSPLPGSRTGIFSNKSPGCLPFDDWRGKRIISSPPTSRYGGKFIVSFKKCIYKSVI